MVEKYLFSEEDSEVLCGFLSPMLAADFKTRAHARDMVDHKWLDVTEADGICEDW